MATTRAELVAKLIEVVDSEYRRTGSGMGIRLSHLKGVASAPTIRKHYPGGISEIAAEAVRVLDAGEKPIHPHLEALASMSLSTNSRDTSELAVRLRLSRIPMDSKIWTNSDIDEVESLLDERDSKELPITERARIHYIAAQYNAKFPASTLGDEWVKVQRLWRQFTGPLDQDMVEFHLSTARDLYIRAHDDDNALLAHIELRNHRIRAIKGDPQIENIQALFRDCIAMRGTSLELTAKTWLRMQEELHARCLGLSTSSIQSIVEDALAAFEGETPEKHKGFTYPAYQLDRLVLLGAQAGYIASDFRNRIPNGARIFLGLAPAIAFGQIEPRQLPDNLIPAALLLLRDAGIAPTKARTEEFRLALQVDLGLTPTETDKVFTEFHLDSFEEPMDPIRAEEAAAALIQFNEAVARLLATPPSFNDWHIREAIHNLRIILDNWAVTRQHRDGFTPKKVRQADYEMISRMQRPTKASVARQGSITGL